MQDQAIELNFNYLSDEKTGRCTFVIRPVYWKEKIIAHYSQDERMQAVLEQEGDFYERIANLCVRRNSKEITEEEKKLGELLVKAACGKYGKRFIARLSGVSPVKAQELLNKFYAIFSKAGYWLKRGNETFADQVIKRLLENAVQKTISKSPDDISYHGELTYSAPRYIYDVSMIKFFKHYFEAELEINGEVVELSVNVETM